MGNFGLLDRREVDLVFHGLQIRWDRCVHGDMTVVHTYDYLMWVVPKKSFSLGWRSLIIIFPGELWGLIMFFLVATTITVYVLTKWEVGAPTILGYTFSSAFFQVVPLLLYTTTKFHRKGHLYRFFMFTFSFYVLIITSLYQSSLITYLTTEHLGEQYEDIQKVVDDNLVGHLFVGGKTVYNVSDFDLWAKILSPGKHVYAENYNQILEVIAYNKTGYSMLMKAGADFEINKYFLDEKNKPMVHMLKEKYLPYLVSMFTPIGHPLNDFFKMALLRLVENGFIGHWMEDLNLKSRKVSFAGNVHQPLSIVHLSGVFYIIPLFSILAVVVFVCEIMHKKYKLRRRFKKKERNSSFDQSLLEFHDVEKWRDEFESMYNHRPTSFIELKTKST